VGRKNHNWLDAYILVTYHDLRIGDLVPKSGNGG